MSKSYNLLKWHSLPLSILVLSSRSQTSHSWILVVWKVLLLWKTFSYSHLRTRPCIMWFRVGALTPLFFWLHNPIRYEHLQSFTRIFNPNHCTPPSFTTHRRQNCNDSGLSPSLLILLHFSLSLTDQKGDKDFLFHFFFCWNSWCELEWVKLLFPQTISSNTVIKTHRKNESSLSTE